MISRFIIEITNNFCNCKTGTNFTLDIVKSENGFNFNIVCKECRSYLSTPLNKIKASIGVANIPFIKNPGFRKKPNLKLIHGGKLSHKKKNEK